MNFSKALKKVLLTGAISCCSLLTFAQDAYVKIGGGYNFGIGYISGTSQTNSGIELVKINYGKGINLNVACGRMFTSNLGLEVSASYLLGKKNKQETTQGQIVGNGYVEDRIEAESYSRMLFVEPAFIVSAGRSGINPYAKVGPILGFGKIHEQIVDHSSGYFNGTTEIHLELKGGVAIGAKAAAGLDFNASSKMSFFAEVAFNSLAYSPTHGEVTEYIEDGNDRTSSMSTSGREVEYENELSNQSTSRDEPTKLLKSNHPFSSVGINLGLKFNL
jgi:hypothetical protein